ncbi:MAG: potassium channel family protein [Beijerinckiaceae bacterium]
MLLQLAVASIVSLANIAVQSIAMAFVIRVIRRREAVKDSLHFRVHLPILMMAVVVVLGLAHMVEVAIWTLAYLALGVAPPEASSLYCALVNFTTLGYGDVVPVERWKLLGPLTAMNGALLLGWSTAVIFAVLMSQDLMNSVGRQKRP